MTELISRMNQAMPLGYQLAFLIRVLVATLCGGAIGLERTKRLKEAGIRTHCLVCCASALIMIVSNTPSPIFPSEMPSSLATAAPIRRALRRRWSAASASSAWPSSTATAAP